MSKVKPIFALSADISSTSVYNRISIKSGETSRKDKKNSIKKKFSLSSKLLKS